MNPCPCGYLGSSQPACRCTPEQVARYQSKLSGPLLDRMDMWVHVPAMSPELLMQAPAGETSAVVQARCQAAHERAVKRQGVSNHRLTPAQLQDLKIEKAAEQWLQQQAARQGWSGRAVHRVLRVAQTIADLAQAEQIDNAHMVQAMHFRVPIKK